MYSRGTAKPAATIITFINISPISGENITAHLKRKEMMIAVAVLVVLGKMHVQTSVVCGGGWCAQVRGDRNTVAWKYIQNYKFYNNNNMLSFFGGKYYICVCVQVSVRVYLSEKVIYFGWR